MYLCALTGKKERDQEEDLERQKNRTYHEEQSTFKKLSKKVIPILAWIFMNDNPSDTNPLEIIQKLSRTQISCQRLPFKISFHYEQFLALEKHEKRNVTSLLPVFIVAAAKY